MQKIDHIEIVDEGVGQLHQHVSRFNVCHDNSPSQKSTRVCPSRWATNPWA
jgi:hypothetical protein